MSLVPGAGETREKLTRGREKGDKPHARAGT
jgi:hypothetical protein